MNFSGVASKFAVPGTPGSIGGTPAAMPAGTGMMGSGGMPKLPDWAKGMMGRAGSGAQMGSQGLSAPGLMRSGMQPFSPFAFNRSNYQFRRPLGF